MEQTAAKTQTSNFNLKREAVELVRPSRSEHGWMAISDLEAIRTEQLAVPASKSGLEVICGASCETGAH